MPGMARLTTLLSLLGFALNTAAVTNYAVTCNEIGDRISTASEVIYPIQALSYHDDIQHWFLSSNDNPACVVEVGSEDDVSLVLQIVGASRTPFAVYSSGHASNPGFSSTQGVHIALKRFNQVELSEDKTVVTLGFGQGWTDVYAALADTDVNVVGGRVPGPGLGGFSLGGGYSWKTNQHGLTCDTVKAFNLVLPDGTITRASKKHNKDLFFALKGGLNRFGIVTSAEFYTHPQPPEVWGGLRMYPASQVPELLNATERFFYENEDPKAGLIVTLDGRALGTSALGLFFYDGPEKPEIFDMFDGLKTTLDNTGKKSYQDLVSSFPAQLALNPRGTFATFSTTEITGRFMEAIRKEAEDIGKVLTFHSGITASYDIEPFTRYGEHATHSAYPHDDSLLPLNLYFVWTDPSEDEWWYARVRQSLATLKEVAIDEGIYNNEFVEYGNYALADTSAERLYGRHNAARLRDIRDEIDPDRVMDLAGGFDI